jgi:hypothetical protein
MKKKPRILFLLLCISQLVMAQKQSIFSRPYHPSFSKGTIKNFIDDISRQAVVIEYASNSIDTGRTVTITGEPSTVGNVLQQVLSEQKINVIEKNNKIILVPSAAVLPEDAFVVYYSVYGLIKEENSEEPLADATVWDPVYRKGILSNAYGYFTMLLPEGKHVLQVSYAGHITRQLDINVDANARIDVRLAAKSDIEEVVVSSPVNNKSNTGKGKTEEEMYENVIGQSDALRSLYLLPGVKNIPELTNGILVRGGSPDQNVFLMDGIPIFNPTHMLGMLSIVDKTSFKSMHLYKSNFPARYSGGISSIIDVFTKDGNMKKWQGEANAGLLAGSFTVEGPLKKDRTAIMVSFRQSWVNPFLHVLNAGIGVNFYDFHFKCTQLAGKKDKLVLNVYAGHDKLNLQKDNTNNQQQWGNKAASLLWNHIIGPRTFISTSAGVSSYSNIAGFRYSMYDSIGVRMENKVYNNFSSVEQYYAGSQLELAASNALRFNIGVKGYFTRTKPFDTNVSSDFADNPDQFNAVPPLSFRKVVGYYENEIRAGRFFLRPGIHISHFSYKDFSNLTWQPRFHAVYKINAAEQLNFSYNHMIQNIHLVTNPYLGINSDVWVPSTDVLRPEESDMINLGYAYNKKKWVASAEIYYKQLRNVTNYVDGKNLFLNTGDWEQNVQSGKGWSYGMEVKMEKRTAKWEGHIGYTLSWNWRQFKDINDGKKFPFKYDRRHDLNVAATYKLNSRWDFSGLWMFATGDVFTLPDRIYADFDAAQQIINPLAPQEYRLVYHSSVTNQYRTLPYHRMDASAGYHHKIGRKIRSLLTIGIYNVYGSPSQFIYDLEGTLGKRSLVVSTKYEFFTITPYVSYTLKF